MDFNVLITGTHATRFIVSWLKVGGQLRYGKDVKMFKSWLESLDLTEDEVGSILFVAENGKLELQNSAENFLNNYYKERQA